MKSISVTFLNDGMKSRYIDGRYIDFPIYIYIDDMGEKYELEAYEGPRTIVRIPK